MLTAAFTAAFSVCVRCRQSLLNQTLLKRSIQTTAVLQRQKTRLSKFSPRLRLEHSVRPSRHGGHVGRPTHDQLTAAKNQPTRSPNQIRLMLSKSLPRWVRSPATLNRLKTMSVSPAHARHILQAFAADAPKRFGGWFPPEEDSKWQLSQIQADIEVDSVPKAIDGALTRRFMAWAVETLPKRSIVPPDVHKTLSTIYNAVDYTHPTEFYPAARMLRRKIHMHVGPTNSGKTHNALRALAGAERGVYASPLRLLAYEVFFRLNSGQIVPLGADPTDPKESFKRSCNLITGEEIRVEDPDAKVVSCTVEMLDSNKRYDVAVVDEIQMLSNPERGGAWTAAVLGLHAEEIHLCGEEGAVPLIQSMLADVGDELIVHRYERLTPLRVASESLHGDLKKIQKGDCIVSFSRTRLFGLKEEVEKATGMRCAIIYGRLPPEVRAEQAELFNDPNSEYDVLVGSDAIGMGLNLKIKRIVFERTVKFDGEEDVALSLSQLKQIAGRAGRFGLHGDDSGGLVTTLDEEDLPVVRKAVDARAAPISKRAVLPTTMEMMHTLEQLTRPRSRFSAMLDVLRTTARLDPSYMLRDLTRQGEDVLPIIDKLCADHTLDERLRIMLAPIQWSDASVKKAAMSLVNMYRMGGDVRLMDSCKGLGFIEALEWVMEMRAASLPPKSTEKESVASEKKDNYSPTPNSNSNPNSNPNPNPNPAPNPAQEKNKAKPVPRIPPLDTLLNLESLYRIAVIYMWFNLRLPLAFPERELAIKLKADTEVAIDWTLARIQAARSRRKERKRKGEGEGKRAVGALFDSLHTPAPAPSREERERERKIEFIHPQTGQLDALTLSP